MELTQVIMPSAVLVHTKYVITLADEEHADELEDSPRTGDCIHPAPRACRPGRVAEVGPPAQEAEPGLDGRSRARAGRGWHLAACPGRTRWAQRRSSSTFAHAPAEHRRTMKVPVPRSLSDSQVASVRAGGGVRRTADGVHAPGGSGARSRAMRSNQPTARSTGGSTAISARRAASR